MNSHFSIDGFHERMRTYRCEEGSLIFLPASVPLAGTPYCAVFPGYTGDALSHQKFIMESLSLGISVLCITPTWLNETKGTRENLKSLSRFTKSIGISEDQPYCIRGVSFGCDLSLAWLNERKQQPFKIAWITPCSASQLEFAGKAMRISVKNDAEPMRFTANVPVWIQRIEGDVVVPVTDSSFLCASEDTRLTILSGADHFQAGELSEASKAVARWFREEL